MAGYIERLVTPRIMEALSDTRIVLLQGARQVGKSTLASNIALVHGGFVTTLDDVDALRFATDDPIGFVSQNPEGLLVIDEVQRAPELVLALKRAVDRDTRPGQFLITGSANLLDLAATHESLAGRVETVSLHSFSQGELTSNTSSFIDRSFTGDLSRGHTSDLTRADYLVRVCQGGYPEALSRSSSQRQERWYRQYLSQIIQRDAQDISALTRLSDLPRLLTVIASRAGQELIWSSLAADLGMPRRTLDPYVRLLETLYLIHIVPAWSANIGARPIKHPKAFLLDSGLAAGVLGVNAAALGPTRPASPAGGLLETFVVGELRRQCGWSEEMVSLYHWRDKGGHEVDIVLETPDGRVVGVEVKAAASVRSGDVTGLSRLRDYLGERFVMGVILYAGQESRWVGQSILAVPLDILWRCED